MVEFQRRDAMKPEIEEATQFMDRWAPVVTTQCTPENLRWNIARARAAEAELDRLKAALAVVKEFMP